MEQKNVFALTMESDAFAGLKTDFNQVLRRTLANMESKESKLAELTLKLKISFEKDSAPDFNDQDNGIRDIIKPTFNHKVSSVMQIKDEKSGVLGGNYELVWDGDQGDFMIRPIDDGQVNMFSDEDKPVPAEPLLLNAAAESDQETDEADEESDNDEETDDNSAIEVEFVAVNDDRTEEDDGYKYDDPEEEASNE